MAMALRSAMPRTSLPSLRFCYGRWSHAIARPPLTDAVMAPPPVPPPPVVLPELDRAPDTTHPDLPGFGAGGSIQLMAVPKKRTTHHKKGIRNGPKALKPVPVIIRCKCCGRVKLPHFYCCSGYRGKTDGENGSN